MGDKLNLIEDKVDAVLEIIDRVRAEKAILTEENSRLKTEIAQLQKQFSSLKLAKSDNNDAVRTKLATVLSRVEELESLAS